MRALKYKLADGTIVNTLAEAQASGQTWVTVLETVQRQGVWGNLGAIFCTRSGQPGRGEIVIIPQPPTFVKQKIAQIFKTEHPEICTNCTIDF